MTKNEKIDIILKYLKEKYENAKCSLEYKKPHELLIAARLSAQCTDKRVNVVTKTLFKTYPTIYSFAKANLDDITKIIRPCGLSNKKAADIVGICSKLIEQFNLKIPNNMKDLLTLPGIGRKTANLMLGELFKKPVIVVDTHFTRIANRLGLTVKTNPKKIEEELKKLIPKEKSTKFCHRVVYFGRDICKAKAPLCNMCGVSNICCYLKQISKTNR